MTKFNQIGYIQEYNKEHYAQVKVDLPKELKEKLIKICKKKKISIRQFVIEAIERAE